MRVFEVMSDDVRTVPPAMPVDEARAIMAGEGVHHLVVTSGGRVVGVLSNRDLSGVIERGATVRDLMTSRVVTVDKDATVRRVASVMQGRTIGCVPVTDNGQLVGIVTTSDLLRLIGQGIDRPEPKRKRFDHHRVPHRKMHVASGRW